MAILFIFAAMEYLSVFMLHTNFLHKFEQRVPHFARTCVEKYIVVENGSYIMTYCRNDKVSALYHMYENALNINEIIMIIFLTCSVRIYVKNVT